MTMIPSESIEIDPADVVILLGHRQLVPEMVDQLAASLDAIGLLQPIIVRPGEGTLWYLVAGHHRLSAAKKLGWGLIPAIVVSVSDIDAKMAEIAENLHRAELTSLERAEQINEWRELAKVRKDSAPSNHQPTETGNRETARELGIDEKAVRNASKIASIIPEAKEAAREAGINDNQSKLLKVAAEAPEKQVATVHELATQKAPEGIEKIAAKIKTAIATLVEMNKAFPGENEDRWTPLPDEIVDALSGEDLRQAYGFFLSINHAFETKKDTAAGIKRLGWEEKHPDKAREKARAEAIREAMEPDLDEAKTETKEEGERWSDRKDEWIAEWEQDNWGDEQEAEFDREFKEQWRRDHGANFPECAIRLRHPDNGGDA
jgi:ParB family chromosome partitioning protein